MIRKKSKKIENKISFGKAYPLYPADHLYFNPNDPFMIRKMEEAIKSLRETPIPDWVLNRRLEDLVD